MNLRSYVVVTGAYWAFTVTDGALRMLVLLYFHDLGYSPLSLALLFLLYEFFGVFTNLIGGWVGTNHGLNRTLVAGLGLQIAALLVLTLHEPEWREWLAVGWVMGAQALSGIAKDLTKMSAKSAVKFVAPDGKLFRLVAILTGSKNALKGVGFFVGAALLGWLDFRGALLSQWQWPWDLCLFSSRRPLVTLVEPPRGQPLASVLKKSSAIQRLSAARFFLFGSRDIWFVVASAGVPRRHARLVLRGHRRVPGVLGHRLRTGAVTSPAPVGIGSAHATWRLWVLAAYGCHRDVYRCVGVDERAPSLDHRCRPVGVWRDVRADVVGAFVSGAGLFDERR